MSLPDHYDTLDIPRDATAADIIQAYRLASDTYELDSQATYSMFNEQQIMEIRQEIEEAYKTLSNNERRKAYDALLIRNGSNHSENINCAGGDENVFYLNPSIPPVNRQKATFSGLHLRNIRKSRGITLIRMSENTGIDVRTLQAIEEEDANLLQMNSGLKQILTAYAAEIETDPQDIISSYPQLS